MRQLQRHMRTFCRLQLVVCAFIMIISFVSEIHPARAGDPIGSKTDTATDVMDGNGNTFVLITPVDPSWGEKKKV